MLSPLQIQSGAHLCSRPPIFWSKWGKTMLGQIGLIRRQSTILSYLPKNLFSATPNQILAGHIFLNSTKLNWKFCFVLRIKSTNAIFIIATIKSPCCLPSFQFWITFQFHKISFSKSSKTTFLPQRASNQLTMLANVFLFCIFQLLHKKRVLWPISRFSRPCPSDEAMLLVSGKISASGKPNWLLCPGI